MNVKTQAECSKCMASQIIMSLLIDIFKNLDFFQSRARGNLEDSGTGLPTTSRHFHHHHHHTGGGFHAPPAATAAEGAGVVCPAGLVNKPSFAVYFLGPHNFWSSQNKCIFIKRTIKVCASCSWCCPWTSVPITCSYMYQDENEDENKNQGFCSFLYVLKKTRDKQTHILCNVILRAWFVRHRHDLELTKTFVLSLVFVFVLAHEQATSAAQLTVSLFLCSSKAT